MKKLPKRNSPHLRVDPNEDAYEALKDAENIGRDAAKREQMRSLHEYTGEDEDTKRTDVHVHVHQHSQPDVEVEASIELGPLKAKGVPKWLVAVLGIIVAFGTAFIAWLAGQH